MFLTISRSKFSQPAPSNKTIIIVDERINDKFRDSTKDFNCPCDETNEN